MISAALILAGAVCIVLAFGNWAARRKYPEVFTQPADNGERLIFLVIFFAGIVQLAIAAAL